MKPFKVHLRQKPIKNGQASLYLDFGRPVYHAGKGRETRREFLGYFIYQKPSGNIERKHNRETMEKAELRKAAAYSEIMSGEYGKAENDAVAARRLKNSDFLTFFRKQAEKRKGTTRSSWLSTLNHLTDFCGGSCTMGEVNKTLVLDFKDYLESETDLKSSSKFLYFSKFKTVVREAAERELLPKNYADGVSNFPASKSSRPFLLDDGVEKIKACSFPELPELRRAALFSILTSLRWSDIIALRYEQIQHDRNLGYFIDFKSKKVGCPEILYLNPEALEVCEYVEGKTGLIFPLKYHEKAKIGKLLAAAGIKKELGIEFHLFRHTFAMRALSKGEPLENVQVMMGHSNISQTQVYAKLLALTKRDAAHRVSLD